MKPESPLEIYARILGVSLSRPESEAAAPQVDAECHPGTADARMPQMASDADLEARVQRVFAELRLESIGRDVEAEINAWFAECRQQEIERASGPETEQE